MRNDQPVGIAFNRIKDAISRGYWNRLHLVEFNDLAEKPQETMQGIYDFLELKQFKHNFNHVKQVTQENDDLHGIPGLHVIRNKVEPLPPYGHQLIGLQAYNKFDDAEFWRPKEAAGGPLRVQL